MKNKKLLLALLASFTIFAFSQTSLTARPADDQVDYSKIKLTVDNKSKKNVEIAFSAEGYFANKTLSVSAGNTASLNLDNLGGAAEGAGVKIEPFFTKIGDQVIISDSGAVAPMQILTKQWPSHQSIELRNIKDFNGQSYTVYANLYAEGEKSSSGKKYIKHFTLTITKIEETASMAPINPLR